MNGVLYIANITDIIAFVPVYVRKKKLNVKNFMVHYIHLMMRDETHVTSFLLSQSRIKKIINGIYKKTLKIFLFL